MLFFARYCLVVALACLLLAGCAGPRGGREAHQAGGEPGAYEDMAVLTEALLLVQRHYVEEVAFKDVVNGAIEGMLGDLDPFSSYLTPKPLAALEEEARGSFGGIGVSVGLERSGVRVIAPIEDSPAFKAGIHAGDTITAVDGRQLEGVSLDEAIAAMRGEKGTPIKVTVERVNGELNEVTLVRDDIKLSSVKGLRNLGDGIGYMRITHFSEHAGEDFATALARLDDEQVTGLIIDLRDNPGGLLDAAVAVAQQVLPRGKEIVTVRGRDGVHPRHSFNAGHCARRYTKLPLALLVNKGSASASEILAGALKANKRAVLVGETTYGKASVQSVIRLALRPDSALRLTTGYYYTPDGELIHGRGIAPDIEVIVPRQEWRQAQMRRMFEEMPEAAGSGMTNMVKGVRDAQLERAREVLLTGRILNNG